MEASVGGWPKFRAKPLLNSQVHTCRAELAVVEQEKDRPRTGGAKSRRKGREADNGWGGLALRGKKGSKGGEDALQPFRPRLSFPKARLGLMDQARREGASQGQGFRPSAAEEESSRLLLTVRMRRTPFRDVQGFPSWRPPSRHAGVAIASPTAACQHHTRPGHDP